ncbi:hypothetical protein PSEHALCIP103_03633 [Pseudoalteromonas haloplanktis]|uniref:WYL domain-containing protein n=1 Tax=Pseudoalteromonas haloplanktis TaxID=228 RepID=A0A9W4VVY9_PSEHA|nr:hypothetical protein [Pseudoalteromonas haloplanktis]CAH9066658.1 hypothetical protein PSEHALCIP103_03633 [Pseudoalteromonas haloplanktis]
MLILRQSTILDIIPLSPRYISSHELMVKLNQFGFDISTRMLQRDLQSLYDQGCFGLEKDTRSKPYG